MFSALITHTLATGNFKQDNSLCAGLLVSISMEDQPFEARNKFTKNNY